MVPPGLFFIQTGLATEPSKPTELFSAGSVGSVANKRVSC